MIEAWSRIETITESDDFLKDALEAAHLPSLLAALAQLTGDLSLLRREPVPDITFGAVEAGYSPDDIALARRLCLTALEKYRDAGCPAAPATSDVHLSALLEFLTGAPARKEFLPLLLEELSPSNEDLRRPRFNKSEIAPDRPFEVVVVGAGMSGILIGIRLAQAGIPFTILEKNQDAGGTWFLNSYPGCRVDNSNHFYSYSFAQRNDWPYSFSPQPVLLDYFQTCAREFGIRDHIRFGTRVEKAKWHEETSVWRIQAQGPDGNVQSFEAQALISGHVAQNWPFGLFEFWQQTRSAEKSDYEIT